MAEIMALWKCHWDTEQVTSMDSDLHQAQAFSIWKSRLYRLVYYKQRQL